MKIVKVSSEVFDVMWRKLQPQQRITGDIPHPAIVLPFLDAMVMLEEQLEVVEYRMPEGDSSENFRLSGFIDWVRGRTA